MQPTSVNLAAKMASRQLTGKFYFCNKCSVVEQGKGSFRINLCSSCIYQYDVDSSPSDKNLEDSDGPDSDYSKDTTSDCSTTESGETSSDISSDCEIIETEEEIEDDDYEPKTKKPKSK